MAGRHIKVRSRDGGEFDCYVATPEGKEKVPAIVLASAVHGVDADVRGIVAAFADKGYIAAAPDLFWRTIPGPLARDDERTKERSQPRLEKIKTGEADMADALAEVRKLPQFNGRAVAMGFCYGGPYAILGPKRLGYDAGISCHGTQFLDFVKELDGFAKPLCVIWGDKDNQAPAPVLEAYRGLASKMKNLDLHIIPDVLHGYMFRGNKTAFHEKTYDLSMARALALLDGLRGDGEGRRAA